MPKKKTINIIKQRWNNFITSRLEPDVIFQTSVSKQISFQTEKETYRIQCLKYKI